MAYNRHFIFKRKTVKNNQTNTSAKVPTVNDSFHNVNHALPGKRLFDEARKTGQLDLNGFGLYDIPPEIYTLNDNNPDLKCFDDDNDLSWWENTFLYKLILASNNLKSVSGKLKFLQNLQYLDLSKNEITELPNELDELLLLNYLNVSYNKLTYLPENIGILENLQHLYISQNNIKFLPSGFCRLVNLEFLDISGNDILHVPSAVMKFIKLKYLNMASNRLTELPEELSQLQELTHFDVSSNRLTNIPEAIGSCFEILNYSNNSLIAFPIQKYSPSLQYIDITNNGIGIFSAKHIAFIPNISKLLMSKNHIEIIPNEIMNLKCLMHLDVSFNYLNSIPYELGTMSTLQILSIEGNPLRAINISVMRKGTDALKKYMRVRNTQQIDSTSAAMEELEINDNYNTEDSDLSLSTSTQSNSKNLLQIDAHELNSVGLVDLSERNLTAIPPEFFQVLKTKRIVTVDVSNNRLIAFPVGITSFGVTLGRLNLSSNRITELPDVFTCFKALNHLDLRNNCLRDLPMSFSYMKQTLTYLDLSNNPFGDKLPESVFEQINLKLLFVSNCSIVNIDAVKFAKLVNLHSLDLSDNQIELLPPKFGFCTSIKNLNLDNNRIRQPLQSVLEYGTEALQRYLRSLIENPTSVMENAN